MDVSLYLREHFKVVSRLGDVVVAITLLIFSTPLILISALLIKINDRGPVFIPRRELDLMGSPIDLEASHHAYKC